MKRNFLINCAMFLLASLFFGCNKDSENIFCENTISSQESKIIQGVISEAEFPFIIKETKSGDHLTLKSAGVWDGPYSRVGISKKIKSKLKMLIPAGVIPGIASGIYVCDVYSISATVNLPTNTLAQVFIPDPCGFSNYSTKEIGVNYTQSVTNSGTTLYMQTYSLVVKSNMLGQIFNQAWPCDANNIIFSYSTMTY